jgi:hypothetical protein
MGPSWAILAAAWAVGQPAGGPVASRPDLLIATQLIASPDLFSDRIRTLWSAREPIERVEEVLREEFARGAPLALRSAAELGLDPFEDVAEQIERRPGRVPGPAKPDPTRPSAPRGRG